MQYSLSILYTCIIYSVYSIYSAYANTIQPSCQAPDLAVVLFSILFLFILNTKNTNIYVLYYIYGILYILAIIYTLICYLIAHYLVFVAVNR